MSTSSPLGPWVFTGIDINPPNPFEPSIRAQENYIFSVSCGSNTTFIYTGDRWNSASDKEKGHDFQFWYPLTFDDISGLINMMHWVDNFTLVLQDTII